MKNSVKINIPAFEGANVGGASVILVLFGWRGEPVGDMVEFLIAFSRPTIESNVAREPFENDKKIGICQDFAKKTMIRSNIFSLPGAVKWVWIIFHSDEVVVQNKKN